MNVLKKLFKNHSRKGLIRAYKRAISEPNMGYPYVRWAISDYKCFKSVDKGMDGFEDLVRWQEIRERYFKKIIELRPRCNEFFSY